MFDGWRVKGEKKNERGRFQINNVNPLEGSESFLLRHKKYGQSRSNPHVR